MKRYRIVEHTTEWTKPTPYGEDKCVNTSYEVQKRFLGFLWWYNPLNIDGMTDGHFDTMHDAQVAINQDMAKTQKTIVAEYE